MKVPGEVHWEVTNKCDRRCRTCIVSSGKPRKNELTTEQAIIVLGFLKRSGVESIFYTGGEPFMRTDFPEMLGETVRLGIQAEVISNGILLTQKTLQLLASLGVPLGISLDGDTPESNDAVRGKGAFVKALYTIKEARKLEIQVTLYITLRAGNIQAIEHFGKMAQELDCEGIHFNEVTLAGRALADKAVQPLTLADHEQLPKRIGKLSLERFHERLKHLPDSCWIDSSSAWYIRSDGNIYACSEVALRRPSFFRGNIFDLATGRVQELKPVAHVRKSESCCYQVWASKRISLTTNTCSVCPMTVSQSPIRTLDELYDELDQFYPDIRQFCKECEYPDCMGYIWALPEEAERMVEKDILIMEINDNIDFIHSFDELPGGGFNVGKRYPVCRYVKGPCRRCSIHDLRPMVCRLWPMGLETHKGKVVLALHQDCLFTKYLEDHQLLIRFRRRALDLMSRLSPRLKGEILKTYHRVDEIATFPYGENRYIILQEFS